MLRHKHVMLFFVSIYSINNLISLSSCDAFEKSTSEFPRIKDIDSPMDVISNSMLSLECIGNKKLHWIFPLHIKNTDKVNIVSTKDNDTYISKLQVKNMNYIDTGEYRCCYVQNNTRNCSRINVYVNDYDHLLLPAPEIINVYNESTTIIPCRGTYSNLNITLWKRNEYVPINDNVKYHSLWGFIINNSTSYFSGLFWCKAKYDRYEQKLMFDLNYNNALVQSPKINLKSIADITKGSEILIKCNGNRLMFWKFPDATLYFDNPRWTVFYSPVNDLEQEISIRITDARVEDSGPFMCCYYGYECHKTKTAAYSFLRVNDPENLYIPRTEIAITDEMYCIPYVVQCIPSMPNVTVELRYYKLNGTSLDTISLQNEFAYLPAIGFVPKHFQITKKSPINVLSIFTCRYTYQNYSLIQLGLPSLLDARYSIEITAINEYPFENDTVEIICEACKFTFKNITWMRKKNGQSNAIPVANDNALSDITIDDESTQYNLKKILKFRSIRSQNIGIYLCNGVTYDNFLEQKSLNLKIKELEKPSFIKTNMNGTNVTVPIGRKFELLCIVHGEPLPVITWYKDGQIFNETNVTGIDFYMNHLKLTIIRVSRRLSGTYRCEAKNKAGVIFAELTLNKNMTIDDKRLIEAKVSRGISSLLLSFIILCVLLSIGLFVVMMIIIRNKLRVKRFF